MSDNCTIIAKLYKKQSVLYHPDKNHAPDAQEKFIAINKAYEKICP
ncbi:MAG: DnaJ domain-containing protein [Parachlamydiaceae bacterium]|nr:DnaJ domain-containing protein [Parachlamydiaceae bacterium]